MLLQSMSSLGKNEGIFFLTLLSDPPSANLASKPSSPSALLSPFHWQQFCLLLLSLAESGSSFVRTPHPFPPSCTVVGTFVYPSPGKIETWRYTRRGGLAWLSASVLEGAEKMRGGLFDGRASIRRGRCRYLETKNEKGI